MTSTTDIATTVSETNVIGIVRHFTRPEVHPYDTVVWERRDARITNYLDGSVAFEQMGVEVPSTWSVNATNILAQKYFRGTLGSSEREWSLKQVADRVADTITEWGQKDGYFVDDEEAETFRAELKYLIIHQKAAFNSPVWFNIGVPGVPQQASACFILSVDDTMDSILDWYREEATVFRGGSGAGVNLSRLRGSTERIKGSANTSSGPMAFMRGADTQAGVIKSGGKTRRAAKMVIMDIDHPDIREFIGCKAREERKTRALREAGFEVDFDGHDTHSIQYQNANNSVRVTDEFMKAVEADSGWDLIARTTGEIVETVKARDLFRQINQASWECADPGMQFDTTINRWHTAPEDGRINGSNPCSEYMHLDNSACNLASLNLLTFLGEDDNFDLEGFRRGVEVIFTAQEIMVGNADYPTVPIADNAKRFRQLGLGYANLGALLMALGLGYDSDEGRAWAGAITALMTGHAYATSAKTAARMGPFAGYHKNREHMLRVLGMHRDEMAKIDNELVPVELLAAAEAAWDQAVEQGGIHGVRNSQASVLAPTGTIGLLMDCDTTGVEPDLGLVKTKKLVGGGTMSIVNQTIPRALRRLGYTEEEIGFARGPQDDRERAGILGYIDEHKSIVGAPHIKSEHMLVFACSMGDNVIDYLGHVRMMAATQPFISGAISKTVNLPETATVEEVERVNKVAWEKGVKAIALYRDNCKVAQPLSTTKAAVQKDIAILEELELGPEAKIIVAKLEADLAAALVAQKVIEVQRPVRERMPRKRPSVTFAFRVADCEGYITVGQYDDGRPGEVFIKVSKQGSTLAGVMDAFSISLSLGLQHGVPLSTYVKKFVNMKFEPAGMTDDPELKLATSIVDYMFRRLAVEYLPFDVREGLGILTIPERKQPTLPGVEESTSIQAPGSIAPEVVDDWAQRVNDAVPETLHRPPPLDAPMCFQCGTTMQRAGSCYVCAGCGTTSGCS